MLRSIALTLSIVALPGLAYAQDATGWTGQFALNGSATTGNNDTTDVGTAIEIKNRGEDWRHTIKATADLSRNEGATNKRRYRLGYKIGRDIGPKTYVYANADYFSDDFGAFKNGAFAGAGLGYSVLTDAPTIWQLEAGLGYRTQKARLIPVAAGDPVSEKQEFLSSRLSSDFEHSFNERVTLNNATELFYSSEDTFITNEIAVTSDMFAGLALRASFRVETHTDVPVGREKTDTISRVGIVYTMD